MQLALAGPSQAFGMLGAIVHCPHARQTRYTGVTQRA